MLSLIVIIVLCYLIGSVPNSIIAGKLLKGIDIREHGSGNAGATNVFRVLGWKAGVAVGLLDLVKGIVTTVYVSQVVFGDMPVSRDLVQVIAGISAVTGHIWTVFAGFKGGKGAGTAAGMFLGLAPGTALISLLVFAAGFLSTRIVSVGSLSAALALAVIMVVRKYWFLHPIGMPLLILSLLISLLIFFTHRSNIVRLIHGTENRFTRK